MSFSTARTVPSVITAPLTFTLLLCGYLQEYIYKNNPHSLDELKRNIEGSILNVMTQSVHNVGSNTKQKVDIRIAEYGGHFQSLS